MTLSCVSSRVRSARLLLAAPAVIVVILLTLAGCGSDPQSEPAEAHHPLTLPVLQKSFDLQFPDDMTSVQIADNLYRGVDNPEGFVVKFTTDRDGFDRFRNSTAQQAPWKDLASQDNDPRSQGDTLPYWFKTPVSRGFCCTQPITGPHQLRIETILADTTDPAAVIVYIEGVAPRFPAWSLADIDSSNVGSTRWMLNKFADRINAVFPPWTTIINVRQLDAAWCQAWLKLSIPSDGLASFIDSSPFAGDVLSKTDRCCADNAEMPWWTPDRASKFLSAKALTGQIFNTSILIDLDEQDFATVYIHCVETNAP